MKKLTLDKKIKIMCEHYAENRRDYTDKDENEGRKDYIVNIRELCGGAKISSDRYIRYFERLWEDYKSR